MAPIVDPAELTSPKLPAAETKNKKRTVTHRGPEDGFPFRVEETFKQRGCGSQPVPRVINRASRTAPHRAISAAAAAQNQTTAVEKRAVSQSDDAFSISTSRAELPSLISDGPTPDQSNIGQTNVSQTNVSQTNVSQTKTSSDVVETVVSAPVVSPTVVTGEDSDSGGVQIPEQSTEQSTPSSNHDTALGRGAEDNSGAHHAERSRTPTPEDASEHGGENSRKSMSQET